MNTYCFIRCIGKFKVPDVWKNNVNGGMNRLYYIIDGEGGYFLRGKKYTFKKKHIYLIPAYDNIPTWSSYDSEESKLNHLFVNFEIIPPIITKEVIELDPSSDPTVEAALTALDKIVEKSKWKINLLNDSQIRYLKATVVYIVNTMISASNVKTLDDKILIRALEKMHKGISEDISIKEIAEESFMSYYGFIRRFKNALGMTPYTYLKQLRLRTATALRDDGATLEEIAEKCGYSDSSALLHAISGEKRLPEIK